MAGSDIRCFRISPDPESARTGLGAEPRSSTIATDDERTVKRVTDALWEMRQVASHEELCRAPIEPIARTHGGELSGNVAPLAYLG